MSPNKSKQAPSGWILSVAFFFPNSDLLFVSVPFFFIGVGRAGAPLAPPPTLILKPRVLVYGPESRREPCLSVGICGCVRPAPEPQSKEERELKGTLKIDHRERFFLSIRGETFHGIRMVEVALKGPESLVHIS